MVTQDVIDFFTYAGSCAKHSKYNITFIFKITLESRFYRYAYHTYIYIYMYIYHYTYIYHFSLFSVMSDSFWPHGLQHTRFPCLSPTSRACSNSCPLSRWCDPTTSSSVVPFSFCLQSLPASGSFLRRQPFASGGQSMGTSASASVLPMNIQGWLLLWLSGWISLQSKGSRVFSPQFKSITSSMLSFLYGPTLTSVYDYWKNHSFDYMDICWQSNVAAFEYAV